MFHFLRIRRSTSRISCSTSWNRYSTSSGIRVPLPPESAFHFVRITQFTEEDRLFFQQIKEKACRSEQIVQTALANPLDKFELGIRKLIEDLMIERMDENDQIVTRYMADKEFQASAFPILAREIFDAVHEQSGD